MILPVVERELRAAARRATTYRMRFFAGLAAMCADIVMQFLLNKLGGAIGDRITGARTTGG